MEIETTKTKLSEAVLAQLMADKLSTLPVERVKKLNLSGNGVYLICLKGKGEDGDGVLAIAKPASEEHDSRAMVEAGSFYRREKAAWLVDHALGFHLVPPTVIRDINGSPASVQEFIPNAKTAWEYGVRLINNRAQGDRELSLQIDMMSVFDFLIYNSDRHDANWIFDEHKIYAIDNGLSFGDDYLLQNHSFYNPNNTPAILICLERLVNDPERLAKLEFDLSQLISKSEVGAFRHRLMYIYNVLKEHYRPDEVPLLFNPQPK